MIKEASKIIYNELINGKFINKEIYQDGVLQANPTYDEIYNNLDQYIEHYELNGFELTSCGDAFFIKTDELTKYREAPALKIQALLLIISRFCKDTGTRIEAILNQQAGLKRENIDLIAELDEVQDILKASDMKKNLALEIDKNLVVRGVAFWNELGGLVLTNSGESIFNEMFKEV
jgi:hypothetical protein